MYSMVELLLLCIYWVGVPLLCGGGTFRCNAMLTTRRWAPNMVSFWGVGVSLEEEGMYCLWW